MSPARLLTAVFSLIAMTSAVRANQFPPSFEDAPLHAVTFVDATEGWAVGDHGVVWHTVDGGKQWERQKSGTRANLRAVQFLTPYIGYAVGRTELPVALGRSNGVVLTTANGGLTWTELSTGIMPGLMAVKFFDDKTGLVAGDSTPAFPCGIFTTSDGGQTWKPQDGPKGVNWVSADLKDPATGFLTGGGVIAGIVNGKPTVCYESNGQQTFSAVKQGNGFVVACNETGEMFISKDSGAKWNSVHSTMRGSFYRFKTVSVFGNTIWVADRAGRGLFKTTNCGETWEFHDIGYPCSLNAIHMLDESTGWAVGELGTILKTGDGGKTWEIQHSGGQRCGVLFIHANGADVPFDTLAMLGAKDGHLCGVVQVGNGVDPARLSSVVRACGGAVTECLNADLKDEDLSQRLAQIIRHWRPETVVTDRAGPMAVVVLSAVNLASPAKGSDGHVVKAVFAVHPTTDKATVQFDYLKVVPELADDVRDFCDVAPLLLGSAAKVPAFRFYTRLDATAGVAQSELVSDTLLARGGTGRRKALPPNWPTDYLAAKEKIAEARRKIDAVVADPAKAGSPEKALERIRTLLVGIPEDLAARAAGIAAGELARTGHWGMAREMYGFVVESFEPYPEAAEAARWLMTFHTSSAVRRRIELGQVLPLPKTVFDTVDDAGVIKPAGHTETVPGVVKAVYRFKTGTAARTWNQFALDLEPKLVAFGPGLATDPSVVRARKLARKLTGITVSGEEPSAAKTIDVPRATAKPHLDGKLDDACWHGAERVTMGMEFRTEVLVRSDERFLYVAIAATHPTGKRIPKVESRDRDADLTGHDRVEFAFDLDRDGATAFRFAVDRRGCVSESCWGDRGWDPKWFVGFENTETGWTAEMAIPLGEMTGLPVAGSVWGFDLVRIVPGVGETRLVPAGDRAELRFAK